MIELTVNGTAHRYDGDPEMPLLWYLRENLGLKGTKYGCGIAQCGACTVHLDGTPVRCCQLPMSAAAGTEVITIEGLAEGERLHPVQAAWIEEDVPQCGYCQAGQIMAAAALLAARPTPSDADIDQMQTNLCRCGTYPRIKKAIRRAGQMMAREG